MPGTSLGQDRKKRSERLAPTAGSCNALQPRSGISGLCTIITSPTQCDNSNPPGFVQRGNATSTTRYLLVNGSVTGSISAYVQFDVAGNAVKAIDARGSATTMEYDDRFGAPDGEARSNSAPSELAGLTSYAFATKVTNALGQVARIGLQRRSQKRQEWQYDEKRSYARAGLHMHLSL